MDTDQAIQMAAEFLRARRIRFVEPGIAVPKDDVFLEVIFVLPEALDPEFVVDPPDTRVRINLETGSAELVQQM
jgi:hypothetical protein